MSLKAFHIVFVMVTVLASMFVGWLFTREYLAEGGWEPLLYAIGSYFTAVGLIFYGKYVLRKLRHISYL